MIEIWKDVIGYAGLYQVSSLGRVRSRHKSSRHDGVGYRVLKIGINGQGRPVVRLSAHKQITTHIVSNLVAAAFVGPRAEGLEVLHRDDLPTHNHVGNLRYGTHLQNMEDRDRNGHTLKGEKHGNAKLTADEVLAIRDAPGTTRALAKLYGVSAMHISTIKRGKTWKHLQPATAVAPVFNVVQD